MNKKREKEIKELKLGLNSNQNTQITESLDKILTNGDASLILDLINVWSEWEDPSIKKKVETILFGLKDKNVLPILVDFLDTDATDDQKWLATNAIWQSGLDASVFLPQLIDFAITHSFTSAIDVMTIIDNCNFEPNDDDLIDNEIRKINSFAQNSKADTVPILLEIKSILVNKKISGE